MRDSRVGRGLTTREIAEQNWLCTRCRAWIWRGAFRHNCKDPLSGVRVISEHAHDQDLWREANPDTPCPCHEWGVGDLRWGTFRSDPSGLMVPERALR